MKKIAVFRRGVVHWSTVDDEDFERFGSLKWFWNRGYAIRGRGKNASVSLHREILGLKAGDGKVTDHINRNRLDNRRSNLRVVTHAENLRNIGSRPGTSSRFRGVSWRDRPSPWLAQATFEGVDHYLGSFKDEHQAASAVNEFWTSHGYAAPNANELRGL